MLPLALVDKPRHEIINFGKCCVITQDLEKVESIVP